MKTLNMVTYFSAGTRWAQRPGSTVDLDNARGKKIAVQVGTVSLDDATARSKKCVDSGKPALAIDQYQAQSDATDEAIRDGVLTPGTKLPPVRQVADGLGLSPTTVNAAWQLLARSGVLHADGRRGTTVAEPRPTGPRRYWQAGGRVADLGLDLASSEPDPALLPDLGPALSRVHTTPPGAYLDDSVLPALEELLRERWPYPVEQLTVVDGAMDAMDLLATSLLRIGDRVVVEDPAFPHLIDLLDALGTQIIGVPLDGEGPRPDRLRDVLESSRPAAVFLQPRAHNPAGISWTPQRAAELASVLAEFPGSVVIEDDAGGDVAAAPPICHAELAHHLAIAARAGRRSRPR
ncbi:aminotransferase class I/II-fold pyridoxal phosphate-dependent enzyme [Nonomuraea sp. NPDC050536]|uniref:aminotransferase class I/II-fold pyridoxal phosphate-dependent enzyme n=1 Tax=Nonomuraea sp. NPDC050536 TaxID=3364366 RepID=UPI0037C5528B